MIHLNTAFSLIFYYCIRFILANVDNMTCKYLFIGTFYNFYHYDVDQTK